MVKKEEVLKKLQHYCAYQERCHSEVRTKLLDLKIYGDLLEEIMGELIKDDFLNEQRFAESYAGGKFRMKKWGKLKITQKLKVKGVSAYCIRKGIGVIEDEGYLKTLSQVIDKYYCERKSKDFSGYVLYINCLKYCQNKGYEYPLIKEMLAKKN